MSEEMPAETIETKEAYLKNDSAEVIDKHTETVSQSSRLIEFPGKKRQEMPAWRKELLEKFKEIQDKRAREAEEEANKESEENSDGVTAVKSAETAKPHLEVVPPTPVNPIVAKALERIERANSKPLNASTNNTAIPKEQRLAAVAGSSHSEPKEREQKLSLIQPKQKAKAAGAKASSGGMQISSSLNGSVNHTQTSMPTLQAAKLQAATPVKSKEKSKHRKNGAATLTDVSSTDTHQSFNSQISKATLAAGVETIKTENTKEVLKEISFQASGILETLSEPPAETFRNKAEIEQYNDYAPYTPRVLSVVFDLFAIVFAASPFAAVLELGGVDWSNELILLSLGGILLIVAFFYMMASVAMIGRTWGMSTLSLRVADAESGDSPTIGQSCGRTILFLLSFAAFCLPFLYSLFDVEGRALHDRIVGTIVLKEE